MGTQRVLRGGILFAILTALIVALLSVAVPASAGPDNDNGEKKGHSKQDTVEGTSDSAESTEEQSAQDSSGTDGSDDKNSPGQERTEPDPEQEQTDPATNGPTACGDYNDEDDGPFDHDSCDGTQGKQGGGGNGKCAGCTGKADDKSPGGQSRNDSNNGYECDHNNGVARGNPAHARCASPEIETPLGPNPPGPNPPGPEGPCDRMPAVPGIQECRIQPTTLPDIIKGDVITPSVRRSLVERPVTRAQRVLPFTGADGIGLFVVLGLVLMVGGGAVLRPRGKRA